MRGVKVMGKGRGWWSESAMLPQCEAEEEAIPAVRWVCCSCVQ